jgi:hypothetical protein
MVVEKAPEAIAGKQRAESVADKPMFREEVCMARDRRGDRQKRGNREDRSGIQNRGVASVRGGAAIIRKGEITHADLRCKWPIEFLHGRPLSPEELEMIRRQIEEGFDNITEVDDEIRGIVARNWPYLLEKVPPEGD